MFSCSSTTSALAIGSLWAYLLLDSSIFAGRSPSDPGLSRSVTLDRLGGGWAISPTWLHVPHSTLPNISPLSISVEPVFSHRVLHMLLVSGDCAAIQWHHQFPHWHRDCPLWDSCLLRGCLLAWVPEASPYSECPGWASLPITHGARVCCVRACAQMHAEVGVVANSFLYTSDMLETMRPGCSTWLLPFWSWHEHFSSNFRVLFLA